MPIHQAIEKYGWRNFKIEVLEECPVEELEQKEKDWILKTGAYEDSMSYNCTRGGDGAAHPVKLSDEQVLEIIELLRMSDLSIKEIANKYDVTPKTVSDINNGHSRLVNEIKYPIRNNFTNTEKDVPLDDINSILNHEKTKKEICKKNNVSLVTLEKIMKKHGVYQVNINIQNALGIPIKQYDINHNCIIAEYPSIMSAANAIGCPYNVFMRNIRKNNGLYKGYYWDISN